MRRKVLFIIAGALIVLASSIGIYTLKTEAAQTGANKPLTLYDGNGTFLGTVIGTAVDQSTSGQPVGISYITYLNSLDGILQYGIAWDQSVTFNGSFKYEAYAQENCQGIPYIGNQGQGQNNHINYPAQWILRDYTGNYYKTTGQNVTIDVLSVHDDLGNSCLNEATSQVVGSVQPITLPANIANPVYPLTVVAP